MASATTSGQADDGGSEAPGSGSSTNGIVREIGHDDFDPVGTLTLILGYLALLVVLWVFMYFVEFLGRGLTVVG